MGIRVSLSWAALVFGSTTLVAAITYGMSSGHSGLALLASLAWLAPVALAAGWLITSRFDAELSARANIADQTLHRIEARTEARWASVQDLAHELRNPLAVMATSLDVALGDPEATAAELRRSASVARRTVDRAAQTIDNLIILARNETPEAKRAGLDLYRLLGEVLAEYLGPIDAQGLAIERVGGVAVVNGDRDALKRAIGNIVGNAVRLSRQHSVLRVGGGSHHGFAWVAVDDQGPGVDPREHDAVFRRFWSHDRASLGGEERTGLGLAITRQIAEQHGGLVTLRSELGGGAEFAIWIPQSVDADPAAISADGVHPVFSPLLGDASGPEQDTERFIRA